MSRFRGCINYWLNLVAADIYFAVGPERRLTLFHIGGLLSGLASLMLTVSTALKFGGWPGLLWGIPLGLFVGFVAAGLAFWIGVGVTWLALSLAAALGLHDTDPPPSADPEA